MPAAVELSIDRLVLDGVGAVDPALVGTALEAELVRRLGSSGRPASDAGHVVDVLRTTADVRPDPRDPASSLGAGIGGAVATGIRGLLAGSG